MLVAGLTGGLGCGKSFVARALSELGAHVIEADELGHEVMLPGQEAWDRIVAAFGTDIVGEDGKIDRAALAAKVFGNPAELDTLNAIVHPAVRERALRMMEQIAERDPHAVVVYVAAILLEAGAHRDVEKVIVVTCTREQQIERAMAREGAIEASVMVRLERQMPLEKKKAFADYLIDTSGTREDTLSQTKIVWEHLKRLA